MLRPLAIVFATLLASAGAASADAQTNLRVEASLGGAWRTSIDSNDRNPGFDVLAAQAEIALGPAWGGIALLAGARGRLGSVDNASAFQLVPGGAALRFPTVYEATGNLGLQFSLGERIRARIGGDAGMLWVVDHRAPLVGGFVAMTFDVANWKGGRLAAIFALRLDVGAVIGDDPTLPRVTSSFAAGVGLRY